MFLFYAKTHQKSICNGNYLNIAAHLDSDNQIQAKSGSNFNFDRYSLNLKFKTCSKKFLQKVNNKIGNDNVY